MDLLNALWVAAWEWIVWNPGWFAISFWVIAGGWLFLQIDKAKVIDPDDGDF